MSSYKGIIVVKVGTSTVVKTGPDGEFLDATSFRRVGSQLIDLQKQGYGIVLVSSAAISGGMVATKLRTRPSRESAIPSLQRLASIGWRHVLNAWDEATDEVILGELLLTGHSLSLAGNERTEALRLIDTLLSHHNIAVINENDAITHDEIAFGDNDTLAATVAAKIAASPLFHSETRLVILSDVDGVYADRHDSSTRIPVISDIDTYQHVVGDIGSTHGTGGMITKFRAARIATMSGVVTYIVNGQLDNAISAAFEGTTGTRFSC